MKENPTIKEELLTLSPAVANLPQSSPFEVPQGYFLDFPKKIMQKIENQLIEKEEPLPIFLQELKKQNPFEVPAGYFDQISPFQLPKETKVVSIFRWQKAVRILAAASIVGILFFAINLENNEVKNEGSNIASVETSNIEETALEGYLKEIDVMDTEFDKSVVLQDAETTLIDIDLQTISEKLTEISEKDISLYLEQAG